MTDRLINVGIFWLPLVASIILSGLAPSVWYGGDKIAALWLGFAGAVSLLLTATFQIQAYIQTNVLQPRLEILPTQRSVLSWNPPLNNMMRVKGENDQIPDDNWRVPLFSIKNAAPVNAQDVKVTWSAAKYDPATITAHAPIFQLKQVTIGENDILLAGGGIPHHNPFSFSATLEKPFITRSAETFIPIGVWNTAALFFLATIPQQSGSRSEPYYFDVDISWSIPDNGKPSRHRIKAVATNTTIPGQGQPLFSALVDFSIDP